VINSSSFIFMNRSEFNYKDNIFDSIRRQPSSKQISQLGNFRWRNFEA